MVPYEVNLKNVSILFEECVGEMGLIALLIIDAMVK